MLDHDRVTSPAGPGLGSQHGRKAQLDRRGHKRQRALLRVALLHTEGTKDLCVVKNISASGLSARVYRRLAGNSHVRVEFRSGELLSGSIVWERDWDVGIVFPKPIDVDSVLASRWITEEGRRRTLPRIDLACRGQLTAGSRSLNVMLQDISQGGARVQTEAPVTDLRNIVLSLADLPPIPGVVRWMGGTEVGISFNECVAFEQLARWIQMQRRPASD
jgi:hypothetical protein